MQLRNASTYFELRRTLHFTLPLTGELRSRPRRRDSLIFSVLTNQRAAFPNCSCLTVDAPEKRVTNCQTVALQERFESGCLDRLQQLFDLSFVIKSGDQRCLVSVDDDAVIQPDCCHEVVA